VSRSGYQERVSPQAAGGIPNPCLPASRLGLFFCASRFIMGALFVKSSPIPPQKLFTLASQAALERFALFGAAHGLCACALVFALAHD